MKQLLPARCFYIYFVVFVGLTAIIVLSSAGHPGVRKDVIGQYKVTNKKQCHRLCWYRPLCTSYSYFAEGSVSCVLHTQAVNDNTATAEPAPDWTETVVSTTVAPNGCDVRPCLDTEVCVPASLPPVYTLSYVCLPLSSKCGDPETVSNGDVIVSGLSQDDVALVTCDDGSVAWPVGVSVELTCLVTSEWTTFSGECFKYEFYNRGNRSRHFLPWEFTENLTLCVKGVFTGAGNGAFYLNLRASSPDIPVQVVFRYQFGNKKITHVVWKKMVNGTFQKPKQHLGDMPLVPGDSFNLTIRRHSDRLQYTLNEVHVYNITLGDAQADPTVANISLVSNFGLGGSVDLTYINLKEAC